MSKKALATDLVYNDMSSSPQLSAHKEPWVTMAP